MQLTPEQIDSILEKLGLPATAENRLYIAGAYQWLSDNTTMDMSDPYNIPPVALLFMLQYVDVIQRIGGGIASESLGGMSQSFTTGSGSLWAAINDLANSLLWPYLKSNVTVFTGESQWRKQSDCCGLAVVYPWELG